MFSKTEYLDMRQVLVRFEDRTHAVSIPCFVDDAKQTSWLLSFWSERTGWPSGRLRIVSWESPFLQISSVSSILGGKGGFGTLLKGQSKQAGAKLTTDFGACRDLQGRRLRHVNDEIKLRKWREMEERKRNGEKVGDDELWSTPSGLYNWHLMTPTWADISKKATYRIKRQFQKLDQKAQKEAQLKKEKEEVYKKSMTMYLDQASSAVESIQQTLPDALKAGLEAAHIKKRKQVDSIAPMIEQQPNSLCTLSGDMVVVMNDKQKSMQIQSKSDFATAVVVLDHQPPPETPFIYFEVTLVTGGLAQIGWACLVGDQRFSPNDDLGDGCGDDAASFGVDGSRQLKLHAGAEDSYPLQWKEGDRLGCVLDTKKGAMSFTVNGTSFGQAFEMQARQLVPALSCNQGQILELHTAKEDFLHFPSRDAVGIQDLLVQSKDGPNSKESDIQVTEVNNDDALLQLKKKGKKETAKCNDDDKKPAKIVVPEPLDLTPFQSAAELENLGLDRLKSALMALQVKCGGTLAERATRLFSLKGLSRKDYPNKVRRNNVTA